MTPAESRQAGLWVGKTPPPTVAKGFPQSDIVRQLGIRHLQTLRQFRGSSPSCAKTKLPHLHRQSGRTRRRRRRSLESHSSARLLIRKQIGRWEVLHLLCVYWLHGGALTVKTAAICWSPQERKQQNNRRRCSGTFVTQHDTVYFLMSHVPSPHTL